MPKHCEFCDKAVPDDHANCQKELETRLITFHGIVENVMAKAAALESVYLSNNIPVTRTAIEDLLSAVEPLNLACGSNWAKRCIRQMRSAHRVAKVAADADRHHELSGAILEHKKHVEEYGGDTIDYLLNGRKEPEKK